MLGHPIADVYSRYRSPVSMCAKAINAGSLSSFFLDVDFVSAAERVVTTLALSIRATRGEQLCHRGLPDYFAVVLEGHLGFLQE